MILMLVVKFALHIFSYFVEMSALSFLLLYSYCCRKKIFVISAEYGRLANNLILFSHFIAYASERNCIVFNPAFYKYAGFFTGTKNNFFCRFPRSYFPCISQKVKLWWYIAAAWIHRRFARFPANRYVKTIELPFLEYNDTFNVKYDKEFIAKASMWLDRNDFEEIVGKSRVIFVRGWRFRAPEFFLKYQNVIRLYFTPLEAVQNKAKIIIAQAREKYQVLVGVHIRKTDYVHWLGGRYLYSTEEYLRLMNDVKKIFAHKNIGFVITSDTIIEKKYFENFNLTLGTGDIMEDLCLLSYCDYIIGPPSTYSGWASFWGNVPLYWILNVNQTISLDQFRVCSVCNGVELILSNGQAFIL